jgi:hypothetical protein
VVARVEGVVAVVEVGAAVAVVGPRLGHGVDLPAGVAAELGAVGVGLDAELADGLGAEGGAGGAARGTVGEVVERRAVEQVHVRPRVLAVDAHGEAVGDHRAPVAVRVGDDPRLQEREVGVVAAVQREVADRVLVHEIAELAGTGLDQRRLGGDGDRLVGRAGIEARVHDRRLADHEVDAPAHHGAEPRQLHPDLPLAEGQPRHHVAAVRPRGGGAVEPGVEVARAHQRAGQDPAGGILHGARELGGRGLGEQGRRHREGEDGRKKESVHAHVTIILTRGRPRLPCDKT